MVSLRAIAHHLETLQQNPGKTVLWTLICFSAGYLLRNAVTVDV